MCVPRLPSPVRSAASSRGTRRTSDNLGGDAFELTLLDLLTSVKDVFPPYRLASLQPVTPWGRTDIVRRRAGCYPRGCRQPPVGRRCACALSLTGVLFEDRCNSSRRWERLRVQNACDFSLACVGSRQGGVWGVCLKCAAPPTHPGILRFNPCKCLIKGGGNPEF